MVVLEKPPPYTENPSSEEMTMSELQLEDIDGTVAAFLRQNQDDATRPIVENVLGVLQGMTPTATEQLVLRLLDIINDADWRQMIMGAIRAHLVAHPLATAFFLIGCFLLMNVPGFRALGPVACNLGAELARRVSDASAAVFNILGALASTGILHGLNVSTADCVGRWLRGEHGQPVLEWMAGQYGHIFEEWARRAYRTPAT